MMKACFFIRLIIGIIVMSLFLGLPVTAIAEKGGLKKKWKILHVMSYHSPWEWTDDQFNGFRHAMKGLDIEYKVFQMDTKQNSSAEWKETAGRQARRIIETWKPDLVYTNDDNAQQYVTRHYINTDIPFVFSGVNENPAIYGFTGSRNVTGVLEQEHFVETVELLRMLIPKVKKIAVIVDEGPTWNGIVKRMKEKLPLLPGLEFVSWDIIKSFREYQNRMNALQTTADAVALLGIFTFSDESGKNMHYTDVLKWTAENSRLPDFSFWKTRIMSGTLCAVTVSGYEQGVAAGKIARGILAEGKKPSAYPMNPTIRGEPVISLARAKKLGISVRTNVLLTAQVVENFRWEK